MAIAHDVIHFFQAVRAEHYNACIAFPSSYAVGCALTEETGEAIQALMQRRIGMGFGDSTSDLYRECVQVAAMAMRLALEGDPSMPAYWKTNDIDRK
jgi:hypothetical protein